VDRPVEPGDDTLVLGPVSSGAKFSPISHRLHLDFTAFREHAAGAIMAVGAVPAMISEGDI
jgi:hypothetical protein